MKVEPLTVEHLARLDVQPQQREWFASRADDLPKLIAGDNQAWCGMVDGRPVAAVGIIDLTEGRGWAWALISPEAGRSFTALHRAVRLGMEHATFRRLEMVTASNFQPARRWAEMLGFMHEGTMRSYCSDGSDAELWARVR